MLQLRPANIVPFIVSQDTFFIFTLSSLLGSNESGGGASIQQFVRHAVSEAIEHGLEMEADVATYAAVLFDHHQQSLSGGVLEAILSVLRTRAMPAHERTDFVWELCDEGQRDKYFPLVYWAK